MMPEGLIILASTVSAALMAGYVSQMPTDPALMSQLPKGRLD